MNLPNLHSALEAVRSSLDEIVARQNVPEFGELRRAHHFLFALPIPGFDHDKDEVDFIIMGINPGESEQSWSIVGGTGHEESFREDFHVKYGKSTKGRENWRRKIQQGVPKGNTILTELFFWSSSSQDFKTRYGALELSPHLDFCVTINKSLITAARPKAVIFSGFAYTRLVSSKFGLTLKSKELCCECGLRIAERHFDGERDWFFLPHFSGSRGVTKKQRELGRQFIEKSVRGSPE